MTLRYFVKIRVHQGMTVDQVRWDLRVTRDLQDKPDLLDQQEKG